MQNTLFQANSTYKHPNDPLSPEHRQHTRMLLQHLSNTPQHHNQCAQKEREPTMKKGTCVRFSMTCYHATLPRLLPRKTGSTLKEWNFAEFLHDLLPRNITTIVTNKDRGPHKTTLPGYSYGLHSMEVEEGGKLNRQSRPSLSVSAFTSLRCYGIEMLQSTLHLTLQINRTDQL
jgi:hypothetical protein